MATTPNPVAMAKMEKHGTTKHLRTDPATIATNGSRQLTPEDRSTAKPLVWGLTTDDPDERNQILNLANALHWPFREKPLRFNSLCALPNLVLANSLVSLDRANILDLRPPWPDVVISSGRHGVPVARWIRCRSGGRARLIHIGCPQVPLGFLDLVITTRQYALPPRPNVLLNTMSLNRVTPKQLCEAAFQWSERLVNLPRPRIAVFIDGSAPTSALNRKSAARLAHEVADHALREGGSLMITAGRKTPRDILRIVLDSIPPEIPLDAWLGEGEDPHHAYLAFANRIVVAGSNIATTCEACTTGKPVRLFELSEQTGLRSRMVSVFRNLAGRQGAIWPFFDSICNRLVGLGLIALSPCTRSFHENLVAQGLVAPFGKIDQVPVAVTCNESIYRAVWRVRKLWPMEGPVALLNNRPPRHGD